MKPVFFGSHRALPHGVAAIATYGIEPHLVNTWNRYIEVEGGRNLLIPAGDISQNNRRS
jgi:hypothetical protein